MDDHNLRLTDEAILATFDQNLFSDPRFYDLNHSTWPLPIDTSQQQMSHNTAQPSTGQQQQHHHQQQQNQNQNQNQQQRRFNTIATTSQELASSQALPTTSAGAALSVSHGLPFSTAAMANNVLAAQNAGLMTDWSQLSQFSQAAYNHQDLTGLNTSDFGTFGGPLQNSPVDFNQTLMLNSTLSMDAPNNFMALSGAPMDMNAQLGAPFQMADFQQELTGFPMQTSARSSPTENFLDARSVSDNGFTLVDDVNHRHSSDWSNDATAGTMSIFNPGQTLSLHIRTNSDSSQTSADVPRSAHSLNSSFSYEEIPFPMNSPQSEVENNFELTHNHHVHHGLPDVHDYVIISPHNSVSPPMNRVEPVQIKPPASSLTTSPSSSAAGSPPKSARKKSPSGVVSPSAKVTKTIAKKSHAATTRKDVVAAEKRVGRRRGPLKPEQRQQAHEIRKLRACLRCKFLKKTCDKGDPCAGCQPSHARLWQVPCTRIDIKDIAYFMKDWKADFERHVSLGFSVGNIKGFSPHERPIYITHGYGHYLPINAREVYVHNDRCFGVDWIETVDSHLTPFEINTAKLSAGMEGISHNVLSDYLDRHIDGGFESFVDEYFEGTYFVTEILKTAYRFYLREKLPVIRKALKLVIAYNLTLHVTMVEGLGEENPVGKVEDRSSKFWGKTVAPVMINFQVKCALADMWRELQKDVLEELSALYSSVYSRDKLKNWPTIFMLAAILLIVWEMIQFDCHYRVPDQAAVQKFCNDMESTPVGVIVGLFQAISQKLPAFAEWDTSKHHHLLASNAAVCDAMTEVRAHVCKYETYLRSRSESKFDRDDFDSLSNKFLSKLVIRAN